MKVLLLWYPKNPHECDLDRNFGYTSQEAIESDKFSDKEKDRINDILDTLKWVPEVLTY